MNDKADSSLARMLSVLDLFDDQRLQWSADDISEALGVSLPTGYRYVKMLTDAGLLQRVDDETDRRRAFITLTDKAADAMARYFAELGSAATLLV